MQLENDDKRSFSDFRGRLRAAIAAAGFNPTTLAKRIGVSHTTVNRWLEDGEPKVGDLQKLANVLNENVQWLVTGDRPSLAASDSSSSVREEPPAYGAKSAAIINYRAAFVSLVTRSDLNWIMDRTEELAASAAAGDTESAKMLTEIFPIIRERIAKLETEMRTHGASKP